MFHHGTLRLSLHVSIFKEWISKLKEGMQTQIRLWSFFSEITEPPFLSPAPGHSLKETAFLLLKGVAFFHSNDIVSVISCVLCAWMLSLLGYVNQLCRENRSF